MLRNSILSCIFCLLLLLALVNYTDFFLRPSNVQLTVGENTFLQESEEGTPGYVHLTAVPAEGVGARETPAVSAKQESVYTEEERVNIHVYELASPSVVNITTRSVREVFFREAVAEGEGSGSVLNKDGYILTNFHVVANANEVQVTLHNGNSYKARIIGADPMNDTAVLKIQAPPEELVPVILGDSSALRVGQKVYAIGNPFGLELTMTTGIISSLNRSLPSQQRHRTIKQVIQSDAAINPGNSGGPLLDSRGWMIGMNTAIASRSGDSAGVGFAVPVNTLARIIPQLIKNGHVARPNLGIEQVMQTQAGLLVAKVEEGGPAENAGICGPKIVRQRKQQGAFIYEYQTLDRSSADTITGVNGKKISTADELLTIIEAFTPGTTVNLNVLRNGKQRTVKVILGETQG